MLHVFVVWNYLNRLITRMKIFFFWKGWGSLSSNVFTLWCLKLISRPPRLCRCFKRRFCLYVRVSFYGVGRTRLCRTPALHASLSSEPTPARPQSLILSSSVSASSPASLRTQVSPTMPWFVRSICLAKRKTPWPSGDNVGSFCPLGSHRHASLL